MGDSDEHGIVIAGGGICGLATALALRRLRDINLSTGAQRETVCGKEEFRCLKRSDLIEALASGLPHGSIRLGCQIVAIAEDSMTSFPMVYLHDGSIISAKVLIGCDGVNSVAAKSLGMKDPKPSKLWTIRGFTNYLHGHSYGSVFTRLLGGGVTLGMLPIDDNLMHWFLSFWGFPDVAKIEDPKHLRDLAMKLVEGFPADASLLVMYSDLSSLSLTSIRYRAPWDLLFSNIRKGTVTVAGDAMHVMGPFIGQGGSCGLEDAVVLARNLAGALNTVALENELGDHLLRKRVAIALDNYARERKLRVLRLSTQTYVIGLMIYNPSKVVRFLVFVLLAVFFGGMSLDHTRYDCGQL